MKKLILLFLLVFLITSVHGIEVSEGSTTTAPDVTELTISSIQQDVKAIRIKTDQIPSKADIDSSFLQLDQKVTQQNQSSSLDTLTVLIGVLVLNDILLIGGFVIAKNAGVIP